MTLREFIMWAIFAFVVGYSVMTIVNQIIIQGATR